MSTTVFPLIHSMTEDGCIHILMRNGSHAHLSFVEYISSSTLSNYIWSDKYTRANVRCVSPAALHTLSQDQIYFYSEQLDTMHLTRKELKCNGA